MSERCQWCNEPAVEQIEIQAGAYKTITVDGRSAKHWTRKPVTAWACAQHAAAAAGGRFVEPRKSKAQDGGQGALI